MSKTLDLLNTKKAQHSASELASLAAFFRIEMFDVLHARQTGHWGGSSSAAEIVTSLYFNYLHIDPKEPQKENRDRFILSKGHASINLYTILAYRGYFDPKILPTFRMHGSILQGHPSMKKVPGVDMSTGALGHGLSIGCGMALSSQLQNKPFRTIVLTGEGCLDEGSTWEALLFAAKYKPQGLVLLIDYNKVQLDGTNADIMPLEPLADKFKSFGWTLAPKIYDGHDTAAILESFAWLDKTDATDTSAASPRVIIYDTVKGKGVSFMEGKNAWHGAPIDDKSYESGRVELAADLEAKEKAL